MLSRQRVELLREIEVLVGIIGLRHHDLEDGERLASDIEARVNTSVATSIAASASRMAEN